MDICRRLQMVSTNFQQNRLVDALGDKSISLDSKLACIPYLSFFVLGFKDCMAQLRSRKPVSELDKRVQKHAEEDSEHWKWFLADLESLNVGGIATKNATEIMMELWSDERRAVREAVYAVSHCIQTYKEPSFRLIMVEVVEAGYALFTQAMSPVMAEAGLYDQLLYFGHTHNHAEAEHELHDHDHDKALEEVVGELSVAQQHNAIDMIDYLELKIDEMHSCFALAIDKAAGLKSASVL